MEADHSQNFNERLSQWVASQGFWFQLRHAMTGGGGWSLAAFHLLSMGLRVLIVLAVVAVGVGFYLSKRVETEEFRESLRDSLSAGVNGEAAEMSGFGRSGGKAVIRRLGIVGGEESFFRSLEAGNIDFDMGFLDAFDSGWTTGMVNVNWLDIELKFGSDSAAHAAAAAATLFKEPEDHRIQGLSVNAARISWGFSERTFGQITESKLRGSRIGNSWRFTLTGGTFSQNWIRNLDIKEMVVLAGPAGVVFEKGELTTADGGEVTFENVKVTGSANPEVSGRLRLTRVPLDHLMPDAFTPLVAGSISGVVDLGGPGSSSQGLTLAGDVTLDERDTVSIRDSFHVLEALDVVDVFNHYKRVDFVRGSFRIESGGGTLAVRDIELEARDLLKMTGAFSVRQPTDDDVLKIVGGTGGSLDLTSVFGIGSPEADPRETKLSLRKAGKAAQAAGGDSATEDKETKFFDDIANTRKFRREQADRVKRSFVFEGQVTLHLADDAFERSTKLRERYPVVPETGRVALPVPLNGTLNGLTARQAEEILLLHKERD